MKRSKPINLSNVSPKKRPPAPSSARSVGELRRLQREVAAVVMTPLTRSGDMQPALRATVEKFIKPNDRLTSVERLELYNRQYWYRTLECLQDDYPGLRTVIGEEKFLALATAYLGKYPSTSFTLRNLAQYLERFLMEEPRWIRTQPVMALDMARLEWARVVAFDGEELPVVTADDLLDSRPEKLRLGLQPYLTLLEMQYPLDEFLLKIKQLGTEALRGEASNAVTERRQRKGKRIRLPKAERVYVAIHRQNNGVYYKRLTREAFAILSALQRGWTLSKACAAVRDVSPEDLQRWFGVWMGFGWFCRR